MMYASRLHLRDVRAVIDPAITAVSSGVLYKAHVLIRSNTIASEAFSVVEMGLYRYLWEDGPAGSKDYTEEL